MTILETKSTLAPNGDDVEALDPELYAAKLERFRAAIQIGLDELERGEGIVVTDIGAFLRELGAEVEAEFE